MTYYANWKEASMMPCCMILMWNVRILLVMLYYRSSQKGPNHHLDIAHKHSAKWVYKFNTEKTVALVWGNDDCPDIPVMLGESVLKIVPSQWHSSVDQASKMMF